MAKLTDGDKWIKLLRAYGPVPDDMATEAEQVDGLANTLGLLRLSFQHPAWDDLIECYPTDTGEFKTVILTGTAGDGKTTLCFRLAEELTGSIPQADKTSQGVQTFEIQTNVGSKKVTMIYDVTGWRRNEGGELSSENVKVLEQAAAHVHGTGDHAFVLAVNDGQLHETIRALPSECSSDLKNFGQELIKLHAEGKKDSERYSSLRLINLSRFSSEALMKLCLDGMLEREEWKCLEQEKDNPLFGPNSPIPSNYALLNNKEIQKRLLTFARIADVTEYHLPLRSILILLTNTLLGHPEARNGVLGPGVMAKRLTQKSRHTAAFHLNFFGCNLSRSQRNRREVYRFLSMLHAGEETTNDLDELIVFGKRDKDLKKDYDSLVAHDPYNQRNPVFDDLVTQYIRGEITDSEDIDFFLVELAHERRRILLHSTDEQVKKYKLWRATFFHYTGDFVDQFLDPICKEEQPKFLHKRKLVAGLNRVWTGLFMDYDPDEVYLATGLDLSTSAVSDLLLKEIMIVDDPPGFSVEPSNGLPKVVIRCENKQFSFNLTLQRFEFLMRVAEGTMPFSFSRESYEDFLSLKQCCLRDLDIQSNPRVLQRLSVLPGGRINKETIRLRIAR